MLYSDDHEQIGVVGRCNFPHRMYNLFEDAGVNLAFEAI